MIKLLLFCWYDDRGVYFNTVKKAISDKILRNDKIKNKIHEPSYVYVFSSPEYYDIFKNSIDETNKYDIYIDNNSCYVIDLEDEEELAEFLLYV